MAATAAPRPARCAPLALAENTITSRWVSPQSRGGLTVDLAAAERVPSGATASGRVRPSGASVRRYGKRTVSLRRGREPRTSAKGKPEARAASRRPPNMALRSAASRASLPRAMTSIARPDALGPPKRRRAIMASSVFRPAISASSCTGEAKSPAALSVAVALKPTNSRVTACSKHTTSIDDVFGEVSCFTI